MGASSRPARRRLKPAALLRTIAGPPHPLVVPLRAAAYAAVLGLLVLAVDQVAVTDTQEPWLQLAGAAIVACSLVRPRPRPFTRHFGSKTWPRSQPSIAPRCHSGAGPKRPATQPAQPGSAKH